MPGCPAPGTSFRSSQWETFPHPGARSAPAPQHEAPVATGRCVRGPAGPRGRCSRTRAGTGGRGGCSQPGPPAAPRLPSSAAAPGQLLGRAHAQLLRAPGTASAPSGLRLTLDNAKAPLPKDLAGTAVPGLRRDPPASALPRHRAGAAGGTWGARPGLGVGRCACEVCSQVQPHVTATPEHSWPRKSGLWTRTVRDSEGWGQQAPTLPTPRCPASGQMTTHAARSHICYVLILFMSKMTKTKPSACSLLLCLTWRVRGPRAALSSAGCRQV